MKVNGRLAVDTNAVIAYREGIPEVCGLIEFAEVIVLPAIVLGELLYGAFNSIRREENEQAIHKFLAQSLFIPIDEDIATRYATVRSELKKIGRPIPENDIWIASTCLEMNVALLTQDIHFDHIPGLHVLNWTINKNN